MRKKSYKNLLILSAALFAVNGCSGMAVDFENNPYEVEVAGMIETCMEMQRDGLLPGVTGGEDRSLEFMSDGVVSLKADGIGFSNNDAGRYPLTLNCTVIKGNGKKIFFLSKPSPGAEWVLLQ